MHARTIIHVVTIGIEASNGSMVFISFKIFFLIKFFHNWDYFQGTNYCYDHEKCETFSSKFKTAQNFCSKIWDESFEVQAENSSMCISFEFDENELNPNKRVALFYQTNNADLFKCGKLKLLPYFLALITLII